MAVPKLFRTRVSPTLISILFIFAAFLSGTAFPPAAPAGNQTFASSCPRENTSKLCPEGDTLYLVSFSVPVSSLENVFEEAFLRNGRVRVIFRGLPGKDKGIVTLAQFSARLRKIVDKAISRVKDSGAYAPGKLRIAIDPRVYAGFHVNSAPAFIFCGKGTQRMVIGDVSLEMAENYLNRFPEKKKILYGPSYKIEEKDLRLVAINFTKNFLQKRHCDYNSVAKKARKRLLTGYRLPHAKKAQRREIKLSSALLDSKNELIWEFKKAFGLTKLPEQVRKVLDISPQKAEELAGTIASTQAGQEIIMADSQDPRQMASVLARLRANKKAVALLSGPMEDYYWKYYPKVFPLHSYEAERWNIRSLPADLLLNNKGVIVIQEGRLPSP